MGLAGFFGLGWFLSFGIQTILAGMAMSFKTDGIECDFGIPRHALFVAKPGKTAEANY